MHIKLSMGLCTRGQGFFHQEQKMLVIWGRFTILDNRLPN